MLAFPASCAIPATLVSCSVIVLAVNKMDSTGNVDPDFYEFYNLGLGDPIAVSAVHGHGTGDLLDECVKYFPPEEAWCPAR